MNHKIISYDYLSFMIFSLKYIQQKQQTPFHSKLFLIWNISIQETRGMYPIQKYQIPLIMEDMPNDLVI